MAVQDEQSGRERFLEAVVAVQQTLLQGLSLQESNERVVQLLGEAAGVSRVYIFEAHPHPEDGRPLVTMRAEWCAPGASVELHNPEMANLDLAASMPLFWKHVSRGELIASAVADLPSEERAILEPQLIRSIVVLPLMVGGRFDGLVGFDDCESSRVWDASRLAVLRAAAAGLSLARERHAAEAARAQQEEDLRALVEHLPDAIFVTVDERLRYVNPTARRLLGVADASTLLGRPPSDWVHPEDREIVRRASAQVARGEQASAGTFRFLRADGEVRTAEAVMVPYTFQGRSARATIWRDVTEARQLQERLLLADRMACMGTLAAGVAHEINNPLTYVLSNVELVQQRLGRSGAPAALQAACSGALEEAREGAERVRRIVRQLRLFTRVEDERLLPVAARSVLELAVAMAGPELRHRARVSWDCAPVPPVLADEGRLGQVLLNLVVNAAHAIPEGNVEGHEIRLSTARAPDGRVMISVRDSGAGIPRDVLPRIFDPFFTTKPVGRGTGLGLSISHSLVKDMGGEIEVESTLGEGTTFRVLLPAADAVVRDLPKAPQRAAPPVQPPARKLRLLVVDDDVGVARALSHLLDEHEVTVAHGGEPARSLIATRADWDLVLCDLMMPDLNGMDLYAWVQTQHPLLAARFVFITGGAFTDRARAFAERMEGRLLHKPFTAAAVRALLQSRSAA